MPRCISTLRRSSLIQFWGHLERGRPAVEEDRLSRTLRAMVLEHGVERVERTLGEIRKSAVDPSADHRSTARADRSRKLPGSGQTKKEKPSASAYVSRLKVPDETRRLLEEAATRYEEKTFLPTSGEIRNFCSVYGLEAPASSSRVSAVPRVFKRLAQLDPEEIRSILQTGSFSGPSRLAPIAAAIRRSSERRSGMEDPIRGAHDSSSDMTGTKGEVSPKPPMPSRI